jgi:integrase
VTWEITQDDRARWPRQAAGEQAAGADEMPGPHPGLLAKLVAAVRPEFRHDILVFAPDDPVFGGAVCRVSGCGRVSHSGTKLCGGHDQRWRMQGKPDLDSFSAGTPPLTGPRLRHLGTASAAAGGRVITPPAGESSIDLRALGPQLRLEIQYALQCRRDERGGKARPLVAQRVVRFLSHSAARSLLGRSAQQWRSEFPAPPNSSAQGLLAYAHRRVEDLALGHGWDAEYPRDTWRLRSLGISGPHATVRFGRIPQPWLKDLAKQWTRTRLAGGISTSLACSAVNAISRFGQFLQTPGENVQLADIDRGVLERYLAYLSAAVPGVRDRIMHIGQLNMFLQAIRRHRWDCGMLPASAALFREDYPRPPEPLPRFLAEHVMAQVEDPARLDKWTDPNWKLITIILIRCGLRISSAAGLAFDCVVTDPGGAPYLRYYNTKMRREALVPIDDELHRMITAHQEHIRARWPGTVPVLFPRTKANIDGTRPVSGPSYRTALYAWLASCDVRDEHGRPMHLTPHQWRHTLGTRLINRDVPQHVVQKILDHDSPQMTAHYARLSDKTVREHWEKARKVDAAGQPVRISPDGPLGDAAWARQQLSRATQTLPNGYCQLPLAKTCPHANSCLTCPMFVTTAEFLPQHHAQKKTTLQLITAAEAAGHARVAEMNKQVAANLDKIITALEAGSDEQEAAADAP